ncbi:unnamed protein product [Protopolystoma xenopodis]|uniref:Uncharacterized protein n=1 Tax=Protopolystoma xenopodis TaxID=117903 RepID=A0A3S5BVL9_9PLAT|nr:unnamed protein product [Protopolystoma xenopodis]
MPSWSFLYEHLQDWHAPSIWTSKISSLNCDSLFSTGDAKPENYPIYDYQEKHCTPKLSEISKLPILGLPGLENIMNVALHREASTDIRTDDEDSFADEDEMNGDEKVDQNERLSIGSNENGLLTSKYTTPVDLITLDSDLLLTAGQIAESARLIASFLSWRLSVGLSYLPLPRLTHAFVSCLFEQLLCFAFLSR